MKSITLETLFGTIQIELSEPDSEGKRTGTIEWSDVPSSEQSDTIESLILAHACAGVDVESPAYIEGINSALEAIDNNS